MKHKNLNEEINRIKSLFGDERLHGNLVSEGRLLTEAKGRAGAASDLLGSIFDGLFKKFPDRKVINFVPPKGLKQDFKITAERAPGGDIIVKKNGVKINHKNIRNIISPLAEKQISTITSKIVNRADLSKFFKEDIYDVYRIMFDDLRKQGMVDNINTVNNIVDGIKGTQVGSRMLNSMEGEDFFKGVYSLNDIKKYHPELFDNVDEITDLKDVLFNQIYKDKLSFGLLADDVGEFAKMLNGFNKPGNVITPQGNMSYTITNKKTGLDGIIHFDDKMSTITLSKELLDNSKIDSKLLDYSPSAVIENQGYYDIKIKSGEMTPDEKQLVDDLLNFKKQKAKINVPDKEIKKIKGDVIDISSTNIKTSQQFFKRRNDVMEQLIKENLPKWRKGVINFWNGIVVDKAWRQGVKQSFSKKYRHHFDPTRLKKGGYALPGSKHTENILDDEQIQFINQFYGFHKKSGALTNKEGLFVKSTDSELIGRGYNVGDIHPDAILAPDFKNRMYTTIKSPFNSDKVLKTLWLNSDNKSFSSLQKTIGRTALTALPFIPWDGQMIIYLMGKQAGKLVSSAALLSPMNDLLNNNGDINTIALPAYQATCKKAIYDKLKEQGIPETKLNFFITEFLNDGFLTDMGNITLGENAVTGKPLRISYNELLSGSWDPEDNRGIDEGEVEYKIKSHVGEYAGGSIKIIAEGDGSIGINILYNPETGNLGKEGEQGVIMISSSLMCSKFSEWFEENKSKMWGKEALDQIKKLVIDSIWSTLLFQGPDMEEFKKNLLSAVTDVSEMELSDWISAAGDGAGVVKDGVVSADKSAGKVIDKIEQKVSGSEVIDVKGADIKKKKL